MNTSGFDNLVKIHGPTPADRWILVDTATQILSLNQRDRTLTSWPVSTAKNGCGNTQGSFQTPTGVHRIAEKIGADSDPNTIFKGRVDTGCQAPVLNEPRSLDDDYVTSRILWLAGVEEGKNLGEGISSYDRFIYIHGTPEEGLIGTPASHGCIRMRNRDVIDLFEQVDVGTLVLIQE